MTESMQSPPPFTRFLYAGRSRAIPAKQPKGLDSFSQAAETNAGGTSWVLHRRERSQNYL